MKYLFILLAGLLLTGCTSLKARFDNPWRPDRIAYANGTSWEPSIKADYIDAKIDRDEAFRQHFQLHEEQKKLQEELAKADNKAWDEKVAIALENRRQADIQEWKDYYADNPNRPRKIKEAIRARSVAIGMTRQELRLSRGSPDNIVTTQTATTYDEEWIYQKESIYFQDGIVSAVQSIR